MMVRSGLALAAAVVMVCAPGRPAAAAVQPPRVIEVTAREYFFTPRVITVEKGEQVTVRLKNAGKENHEWELEALHVEIRPIRPGTTGEITFKAPDRAGAYEFACHVNGHYEKGMRGFLRVR